MAKKPGPKPRGYTERFAVMMQPEERRMLAELAEADGINESDALRLAIRRAHAERISPKRNPKTKTK